MTLIPIFFCESCIDIALFFRDSGLETPSCTEPTVPRRSLFSMSRAAEASWSMSASVPDEALLARG